MHRGRQEPPSMLGAGACAAPCASTVSTPARAAPDVRRRGLRGPLRLYGFNERLLLVLEIAAFLAVGGFLELTAREIEAV